MIFVGSVFTHMLPDDVESYVREIARLLAPDSMCVASYFLLNDETRTGVDAGRSFLSFGAMHPSGLCRCTTRPQPKPRSLLKSHSSGGSTSGPGCTFARCVVAAGGAVRRTIKTC